MELFKLLGTIVIENTEAKKRLQEVREEGGETESKLSKAFKKIGGVVATAFAADKIKDFGIGCIQAAADASATASQFSQVFGELEESAGKSLEKIASDAGITESRMKGSFTKIAAFAKTTGMDTESALNLTERSMIAVADSAAFYDRSLEETTESLQSFLKGNYENDAALGLSCTEVTRNTAAMELYGEEFKNLSESQKQLTLLKMVEDANKLSGALGQAARESNTWTNQTGNLKQAWVDLTSALGSPILENVSTAIGTLAEKVMGLTGKIESGKNPTQILMDKFRELKKWLEDVGSYASKKLQPIFDDLEKVFTAVKDALQPLIDKIIEYVTSGEAAKDITQNIKDTIDLLVTAYTDVKEAIKKVIDGFKDAITWGKEHETAVLLIAVAISTLTTAIVAYNVAAAIKKAGGIAEIAQLGILQVQIWALTAAETAHTVATNLATAATTAFGAVLSFVTSPITLVIVAIGALVAAGVALYKNWDEIKAKAVELFENLQKTFGLIRDVAAEIMNVIWSNMVSAWENIKISISSKISSIVSTVSGKFEEVKNSITNKINSAKDAVKNAIDKIKGFFNFTFKWPHIPLPHFSISPSGWTVGDLLDGVIPSLGVEWYAKGGVLEEPTAFGINGNKLMVGGEAGPEAVAPIDVLQNYIAEAVAAQNTGLVDILQKILAAILSNNEEMKDKFIEALEEMRFDINNREFARLVKAVN